jgi:hypothetical protein
VFGLPAVMTALLVYGVAVLLRQRALSVAALLLSAPFCLWISGYPKIRHLGLLILITNLIGVIALWRGQRFAAVVMWVPFLMIAGSLAFLVMRRHF